MTSSAHAQHRPVDRVPQADQIAANTEAANRIVSKATEMAADALAQRTKDAETATSAQWA
jgi:hypothetical protein